MISLFRKGYMLFIISYNFFLYFLLESGKFVLVASNTLLSVKFGVNKCMILISNKSCPVMGTQKSPGKINFG